MHFTETCLICDLLFFMAVFFHSILYFEYRNLIINLNLYPAGSLMTAVNNKNATQTGVRNRI